jgi:hypothetical protein
LEIITEGKVYRNLGDSPDEICYVRVPHQIYGLMNARTDDLTQNQTTGRKECCQRKLMGFTILVFI